MRTELIKCRAELTNKLGPNYRQKNTIKHAGSIPRKKYYVILSKAWMHYYNDFENLIS